MALTRKQSSFTYSSASGGQEYLFDVVVDEQGLISVKNIRSPLGLIADAVTGVPESVVEDMMTSKDLVTQLVSETQVDSGSLVFAGDTYKDATIAAGVLNNTNYRVVYTTPDGTVLTTSLETTTSFRATAPSAYGTVAVPLTVTYVVLVATQQASTTSGTETFAVADAGTRTVTFGTAFDSAGYRVVLTPGGFFQAYVINKTVAGFTIVLGYTLAAATTATVGYVVFVG